MASASKFIYGNLRLRKIYYFHQCWLKLRRSLSVLCFYFDVFVLEALRGLTDVYTDFKEGLRGLELRIWITIYFPSTTFLIVTKSFSPATITVTNLHWKTKQENRTIALADPRSRQGRTPIGPISFIFMQFSAKLSSNNRFSAQSQALVPPYVWEILCGLRGYPMTFSQAARKTLSDDHSINRSSFITFVYEFWKNSS